MNYQYILYATSKSCPEINMLPALLICRNQISHGWSSDNEQMKENSQSPINIEAFCAPQKFRYYVRVAQNSKAICKVYRGEQLHIARAKLLQAKHCVKSTVLRSSLLNSKNKINWYKQQNYLNMQMLSEESEARRTITETKPNNHSENQ